MNTQSSTESVEKEQLRRKHRRTFFKKLKLLLPCACLLCFTFFFFGPYETVALNTASFSYHYSSIILPLLLTALCASLCLTLVVSMLRGEFFYAAVSAIFSAALCIYLQAAFFNSTLTILTGDAVDWAGQKTQMILNLAVWIFVFAAVFAIMHLRRKVFRSIVVYASLLLIFMQTVSSFAILFGAYEGTQKRESSTYTLQDTGLYEYSKDRNVLVFVLDRLDYDYIERSLAQRPDMLEYLDGFVQYDNATSVYNRTSPALCHLLTGNTELAFHSTPETYYSESWHSSGRSILEDIHAQGYTIELYTKINCLFSKPSEDAQHVLNLSDGNEKLLPLNVIKRMIMLSCYRFFPLAVKPYFFKSSDYYNSYVYASSPYELDDGKNGAGFVNIEASRTADSFKLIHFLGSHAPYFLTAGGTSCDYTTSVEEQTIGCFTLLKKAFDRMKQLGIYENSSIIITADHGTGTDDLTGLAKATRIGLFYKPAGSADTPLEISSAPVSTQNIPATILKSMGAEYSAYGPALDDIPEDAMVTRVHYKPDLPSESIDLEVYNVDVYHITGHASDLNNWEHAERFETPAKYLPI